MSGSNSTTILNDTTYGSTNVPLGPGTYEIEATGAGGGSAGSNTGGLGGVVEGTFTFTANEPLSILVGQAGSGGGGGGATFVVGPSTTALLVAGGGGASYGGNGGNAQGIVPSGSSTLGGTGGADVGGIPGGGGGGRPAADALRPEREPGPGQHRARLQARVARAAVASRGAAQTVAGVRRSPSSHGPRGGDECRAERVGQPGVGRPRQPSLAADLMPTALNAGRPGPRLPPFPSRTPLCA